MFGSLTDFVFLTASVHGSLKFLSPKGSTYTELRVYLQIISIMIILTHEKSTSNM